MTEFARRLLRLAMLAMSMLASQAFAAPAPKAPRVSRGRRGPRETDRVVSARAGFAGLGLALVLGAHAMFAAAAGGSSVSAGPSRPSVAHAGGHWQPSFVPDDPDFPAQWNLASGATGLHVADAWDVGTGDGVVVAVVGNGIYSHADLDANVLPGYDFISDAVEARDGDGRDADPAVPGIFSDCPAYFYANWSGTASASAIAAVTNNGRAIAGVAPGAKLVPVRAAALTCTGTEQDIADAIAWAAGAAVAGVPANAHPADVIAVVLGGEGSCSPAIQSAIDGAAARGATVVVSAGSAAMRTSGNRFASCDGVISVGAIFDTGVRIDFSNFGPGLDVVAPGYSVPVLSYTFRNESTPLYGNEIAAAQVAGIVALMQGEGAQSPEQVEAILKGTAHRTSPCPEGCGAGLPTASSAVAAMTTPTLFVLAADPLTYEGATTQSRRFDVVLSVPSPAPVTFDLATLDGSAKAGSDYASIVRPGQVMPAGQTRMSFDVDVLGDAEQEPDEGFQVVLSNVSGAATARTVAVQNLVNDDAVDLVNSETVMLGNKAPEWYRLYRFSVPYGASDPTILVYRGNGDIEQWVRADSPPLAEPDADCVGTSPGVPICWLPEVVDGDVDYYVRVLTDSSGLVDGRITGSFVPPPAVSIADATLVEADAGAKSQSFVVSLSRTTEVPVFVTVHTVADTAQAGGDYVEREAVVTVPAGASSALFTVSTLGDTTLEPRESYRAVIQSARGATVADGDATGTIIDNDGPLLSINDIAVSEGDAGTKQMTFTVRLQEPASVPVGYDIATSNGSAMAGSDYDALALAGQVIPAGQLARVHSIVVHGDTTAEETELLLVNLRQPTGAALLDGQGIGYILDDDGPALSILDASTVEGTPGWHYMDVPVRLSKPATVPVSFDLKVIGGTASLANDDYSIYNLGRVTLAPGTTGFSARLLLVNGDNRPEANETVEVRLQNVTGASKYDWLSTVTIVNDDGPTLSVQNSGITESNYGTKVATFLVTLSQAATVPVTYSIATGNGTATAGSDYVAKALSGETIPAGMTSRTFEVVVNGDLAVEGNETFKVSIADAGGATIFRPQAVGTITDND